MRQKMLSKNEAVKIELNEKQRKRKKTNGGKRETY